MALIQDPDQLNDEPAATGATEVFIDPTARTIQLVETGNLSADGVTIKGVYSFLKEEWRNDPHGKNLPAVPFPMTPITDESYELIGGWDWADDATRYLIRTGGWTVRNAAGGVTQQWAGIIGLGFIESDDQLYYDQGVGASVVQLTGQVNQAVQILSDPNGDGNTSDGFDFRTEFALFVREYGQAFGSADIASIGVDSMQAIAYRFPLGTAPDLKITAADTDIDSNGDGTADVAPYAAMSITYMPHVNRGTWADATGYALDDVVQGSDGRWYIATIGGTSSGASSDLAGGSDAGVTWVSFAGEREIGSDWYAFGVAIDGAGGSAEQIYEFAQWSLRQTVDIDAGTGTVIGETADSLLEFVGDTLGTLAQSNGNGVTVDNFAPIDTNRIGFVDDLGQTRTFPFVAVLQLNLNDNLVADPDARYFVFYTDPDATPDGDEYGDVGGILAVNKAGVDMTGDVAGQSVISIEYDYDGDATGGRIPGSDVPITVVALGLDTGQYVRATGTISRSTSNAVSLVAPLERNYANA